MKGKHLEEIKALLEQKWAQYEQTDFIADDPICIPHLFHKKKDIEIAGFLTAVIAWGQRKSILNSAHKLMDMMSNQPADFILNHSEQEREKLPRFVHRTFQQIDLVYFFKALQQIYRTHEDLESFFLSSKEKAMAARIHHFKQQFFAFSHEARSLKHLPDPFKKSSSKRFNMFLRWMVRSSQRGVDFGIWKRVQPSELLLPLDVHTGNIARQLGLLQRKQNDWQAVEEISSILHSFDPTDPIKYDFALFGMGVYGDLEG